MPQKQWDAILEKAEKFSGKKRAVINAELHYTEIDDVLDDEENLEKYNEALYDPMFD